MPTLRSASAALSPPRISVLMATYNGSPYIRQSIASLLSQTETDFELIVVDDCSTDDTPAVLASINDPRLKVFRNEVNLGVVASRNRCFALSTGDYIAMQDHDDLSRPTRLAQQATFLDGHPETALLATAAQSFQGGRILPLRPPSVSSSGLLSWLLLVANPLVCSSIMVRAASIESLGAFMRPGYTYADDYDLYHRLMHAGNIARLDTPMVLYRIHDRMASRAHEAVMSSNAIRVLTPVYTPWFGGDAAQAAHLVVHHVASARALPDIKSLRQLQDVLRRLTDSFFAAHDSSESDREMILQQAELLWERVILNTSRHTRYSIGPSDCSLHLRPGKSLGNRARGVFHRVPFQAAVRRMGRAVLHDLTAPTRPVSARTLVGTRLSPLPADSTQPPTMFVVVDTEAEFDWSRPLDRALTSVAAMSHIGRGQAVFDRWGLRPVYVVDYPVATSPTSIAVLRQIHERGGCEIGAHLHPWTTPPFDESIAEKNSFPGNLPAALEHAKLRNLVEVVERSFGVRPLFYKAGRYGFGPNTAKILASLGFKVDFSMLPGANLSAKGGPDFTGIGPSLYRLGHDELIAAPMTRSVVGLVPALGRWADRLGPSHFLSHVPLRPILARSRIADTITLTPEGVTTSEQVRLIRFLLRRGQRTFILHYHSPTFAAGNTSYTPDESSVARFTESLEDVCRFFFDELGGLPGYPRDLVALATRSNPSSHP